ncbi:MAG: TIGR03016 family PEP-CTERM system-associated outer membrane protein [Solirubrobacterales bacterium]
MVSIGAGAPALAGDWTVRPAIQVDEKWSDNVYTTAHDKQSDFITSVMPGIQVEGQGGGVKAALNYDIAYDHYAENNDLDGFRHDGMGLAEAELLKDLFYLDLRGSVSEEELDAIDPTAAGGRTTAANRVRLGAYTFMPNLRHSFGPWALGLASYRHFGTKYWPTANVDLTGQVEDSTGDGGSIQLRSGENFSRILWEVTGDTMRVERGGRIFTATGEQLRGEYRLSPQWGILAHGGHDYINDDGLDSNTYSGPFYGGGLHWTPAEKSDLRVEVGRRYNVVDIGVRGNFQLGAFTTLRLLHDTTVTTEAQTMADALGVVERDEMGHFIDPFSGLLADPAATPFNRTDSVFKLRRSQGSLTWRHHRDTISLVGRYMTRQDMVGPQSASSEATAVTGTVVWTHQLTERLSGTARLARDQILNAAIASREGVKYRASFDLAYQLTDRAQVVAGYRYVDSQRENRDNVAENMIGIGLRYSLN